MPIEELVARASATGPAQTLEKLERAIASRGMTVFARIDHAAGAAEAGLELRPTLVVIFGSARAGTPLMALSQYVGIDLPLKALVSQDESGRTFVSYNDPAWIARQFGLPEAAEPVVAKMQSALEAVAKDATAAD